MKYALIYCFCCLCFITAHGQTYENTYTSSLYTSMVQFAMAGSKYVVVDDSNKQLRIYNLDHSVYKIINVPQYPGYTCHIEQASYLSDRLFNNDNLIEYVVHYDPPILKIINENSVVLDSIPGCDYFLPHLYADQNGHYKFLARHGDKVSIFALPGYMLCAPVCGDQQ